MLNLFMAVCLERYAENRSRPPPLVNRTHVGEFYALWMDLDTEASGWIPSAQLYELLLALPPPLGKPLAGLFEPRLRLGDFERMHVHLSSDGKLYFGDLLTALTAGAYEVDLMELPEELSRHVASKALISRRAAARKGSVAGSKSSSLDQLGLLQTPVPAAPAPLPTRLGGVASRLCGFHGSAGRMPAVERAHSVVERNGNTLTGEGELVSVSDILAACRLQSYARGVLARRRLRLAAMPPPAVMPRQTPAGHSSVEAAQQMEPMQENLQSAPTIEPNSIDWVMMSPPHGLARDSDALLEDHERGGTEEAPPHVNDELLPVSFSPT